MTERGLYFDIIATNPEDLAAKAAKTREFLGELGVAHKALTGQELINHVLTTDDPDNLVFELKD